MIKLNLRPLPLGEFSLHDVVAVSYETENGCAEDDSLESPVYDFNIALYKHNKLMNWIQLCPCEDSNQIEFRNRFIDKNEECNVINEKILHYAEKWAAQHGYQKIMIRACEVSVPYYLRMQYTAYGAPVQDKGATLHTLVKML